MPVKAKRSTYNYSLPITVKKPGMLCQQTGCLALLFLWVTPSQSQVVKSLPTFQLSQNWNSFPICNTMLLLKPIGESPAGQCWESLWYVWLNQTEESSVSSIVRTQHALVFADSAAQIKRGGFYFVLFLCQGKVEKIKNISKGAVEGTQPNSPPFRRLICCPEISLKNQQFTCWVALFFADQQSCINIEKQQSNATVKYVPNRASVAFQ